MSAVWFWYGRMDMWLGAQTRLLPTPTRSSKRFAALMQKTMIG